MYVNIQIKVKNVGTFTPKGFYYKGEGKKSKLVIVGCERENHYKKQTYLLSDCELSFRKINQFGDEFTL